MDVNNINKVNKASKINSNKMNQSLELLGFYQIKNQLASYTLSKQARDMAMTLEPFLSELELRKQLRDTTEARKMLEDIGSPPLPAMEDTENSIDKAVKGEMLLPEEMEQIGQFLASMKRLISYLEKGKSKDISLAYYSENLASLDGLRSELERSIRNGRVDDYASNELRNIRRQLQLLEEKISKKAEQMLKANQNYTNDAMIVRRNGRICIPIKKEYKSRVPGTVVDQSSTGATLFIEPQAIGRMQEEYEILGIEEDCEERRILYVLMDQIAEKEAEIREDIRVSAKLDYVFAKGKMSLDMEAKEPKINLERRIQLQAGCHPMLAKDSCVPLDFRIGDGIRGVIITGPNTGGKTVAIKTVALLSAMACSGLHIPCETADIAMNSQILCDIGDGQNITDNLSTFSAHISNVLSILQNINQESLVILDELGSGTDPAEGMGIAIAILEQLRMSNALFLATTHYPEVKEYALRHEEIANARMAFDRESLKPLYRLEIGKSGESCALYIAKRLGIPNQMLQVAAQEAYGDQAETMIEQMGWKERDGGIMRTKAPRIQKASSYKKEAVHGTEFTRGDSVMVHPEQVIGIVVTPADQNGEILVQIQKEKKLISHKRLKLKVAASELYPDDYDFSIVFDSVEHRKASHQMDRKYQEGLVIVGN